MLVEKTIIVTGAAGALGSAVCEKALFYGATVFGLDLSTSQLKHDQFSPQSVDLLDTDAVQSTLASIGVIDSLINIAGGFAMGAPASDPSDDQWDHMMAMNVTTLRNMVKAATPALKASGGSIVNVGAFGALAGSAGMSAYAVSKSAVMRITESLADELKADNVNVNAVLPTIIDTPANRADMPDADPANWVHPLDLAEVMCFLVSDRASAVTGALLPVRGKL